MRLAVISDSRMFGDILAAAIEKCGHQVGSIWDGGMPLPDAIKEAVILIHWVGTDAIAALVEHLQDLAPEAKLVFLCQGSQLDQVALLHGDISDAVLSDEHGFELVARSLSVLEAGYRIFPRETGRGPGISRQGGSPEAAPDVPLSPRERAILALVAAGMTNKEAARELSINDSTIKVHLRSVFQKIRVQNRTQAAVWAMQNLPATAAPAAADRSDGQAALDGYGAAA